MKLRQVFTRALHAEPAGAALGSRLEVASAQEKLKACLADSGGRRVGG